MASAEKLHDIKVQMEYYLSDTNLQKDSFFHEKIRTDPDGYVDMDYFMKCNKIINAKWTKEELIEGIKQSDEIELNDKNDRVRRKGNKPLPELTLLSKKRKKDEQQETETKPNIDPIILEVSSEEEYSKWKNILHEFKEENPSLDVIYGRFKEKEGHFAVVPQKENELQFTNEFECDNVKFKVCKCEGENLINFWKNHGTHFEMCTKKAKNDKNKKGKKKQTYFEKPIEIGGDKYSDVSLIKANARKILSNHKDNDKIEGKDYDFVMDVLKYHHNYEDKVKDLDYITTGKPDKFSNSRCYFIVKKNGEKIDFSIQKCIDCIEEKHIRK